MTPTPELVRQHTVALYVPGTGLRVLVDKLECGLDEAPSSALDTLRLLLQQRPLIRARVVRTDQVTELLDEHGTPLLTTDHTPS